MGFVICMGGLGGAVSALLTPRDATGLLDASNAFGLTHSETLFEVADLNEFSDTGSKTGTICSGGGSVVV